MESSILKIVGQVAGIGGIAIGTFLLLFREVIRKNIFPSLTKQQGYNLLKLILFFVWTIALAGIVAWSYAVYLSNKNIDKVDKQKREDEQQNKIDSFNAQLKITPEEFLSLLKEKYSEGYWTHKPTNQEVIEFVERAADDADWVATIWEDIVKEVVDARFNNDPSKNRTLLEKYQWLPARNMRPFTSLTYFYEELTLLTKGKTKYSAWSNGFLSALYRVIRSRKITKQVFEEYITSSNDTFLDQRNNLDDLKDLKNLSRSIEVLQREAAALHVLALSIKVQNAEEAKNNYH